MFALLDELGTTIVTGCNIGVGLAQADIVCAARDILADLSDALIEVLLNRPTGGSRGERGCKGGWGKRARGSGCVGGRSRSGAIMGAGGNGRDWGAGRIALLCKEDGEDD